MPLPAQLSVLKIRTDMRSDVRAAAVCLMEPE